MLPVIADVDRRPQLRASARRATAARIWAVRSGRGDRCAGEDVGCDRGGRPDAVRTRARRLAHCKGKFDTVMDPRDRSTGVKRPLSAPRPGSRSPPGSGSRPLYRSSRDDVYAYVATLLRDRAAAEDVTALAFERAYRRRRTFDRRRGEERAWLFGIARNAALDELRRRKRLGRAGGRPRGRRRRRRTTTPRSRSAARRSALRWRRLPAREREIVALKFHAGLSQRRARAGARRQRVERRHAAAPDDGEAEEGLR